MPRPLKPDFKPAHAPLIKPTSGQTVVVLPVAGPDDLLIGDALAEAVAESLRERDIPASVRGGTSEFGLMLTGHARFEGVGTAGRLKVSWELVDGDGQPVGTYLYEEAATREVWESGDPDFLRGVADGAAPALVSMARGEPAPRPEPAPTPAAGPANVLRVHLMPVDGAPGDGNRSLFGAMAAQLRRDGVPMTANPDDADLRLRGVVSMGDPEAGRQRIRIVWTALDKAEESLGEIRQANQVPAGSLDGPWGPVARLVARAASGGLLDLIRRNGVGREEIPATDGRPSPVPARTPPPRATSQYEIGTPGG